MNWLILWAIVFGVGCAFGGPLGGVGLVAITVICCVPRK